MKIYIILLLLPCSAFSQLKINKLNKLSIPSSVKYDGHMINAVSWKDSLGDNIIITTETGETPSKNMDADYKDAALYAYHYIARKNSYTLTWKVNDQVKDCLVDIRANFIKNTFAITDLNNDGKAEAWLMYKTVCHGDVSPSNMKIIMYEDDKKYAMRGRNKVPASANKYIVGEYTFDSAFKYAPKVFREYALKLWHKNIVETWE